LQHRKSKSGSQMFETSDELLPHFSHYDRFEAVD
jgi:hypothetical protein